jgi:hypothetical protein
VEEAAVYCLAYVEPNRGRGRPSSVSPDTNWVILVVFAIFIDSWMFVFLTALLRYGLGINTSYGLCSSAIYLCLVFYVTTKIVRGNIPNLQPQ